MLEELRRRNYAESTIHTYVNTVEHFSRHFHRPPDQLGPEQSRQYQAALFTQLGRRAWTGISSLCYRRLQPRQPVHSLWGCFASQCYRWKTPTTAITASPPGDRSTQIAR
jgi:hypothetical protein